jgi:hypothetical protein
MRYELGLYIPEDDILHSHRRENLNTLVCISRHNFKQGGFPLKYVTFGMTLKARRAMYVSPMLTFEGRNCRESSLAGGVTGPDRRPNLPH